MASAMEQLGEGIATAIRKIGEAADHLTQAISHSDDAHEHLGRALQGAAADDAVAAARQQQAVPQQLAAQREQIRLAATLIDAYRQNIGLPAVEPTPNPTPAAPQAGETAPGIQTRRSELPRPPRPGKTHGRWFTPDGDAVMLESGRGGQYYGAARQRGVELGLTYGRPGAEPAIARHLEVQFAMRMADQDISHAEIEINRPVCGSRPGIDDDLPETCDKQLARFLPTGSTLRVKDGSSPTGRLYNGKECRR
ncbi:hypothetical protein INP57_04420 [Saccharopolyspora sp. HNM0986]|uniref:DddA-like double-stranded DNA deaminase toxin n=1 Tax=Saccharopolyspora galaxeae TaxID=2781241 RepID=UPI00190BAA65|nr:DddA-like double-stranded DNA deaminase toxin [Saccharopolyspora sp. HNM0986]MBK0866045.1 hypothetical protein [Saccharopolyspora sp. HNM0986]